MNSVTFRRPFSFLMVVRPYGKSKTILKWKVDILGDKYYLFSRVGKSKTILKEKLDFLGDKCHVFSRV